MPLMLVLWIASAFLCSYIAGQKNRARGPWFFAGLFFSLFAIIAIVAIPALTEEERTVREKPYPDDPELEEWKRQMREPP